jgi:hypothetical protein
MKRIVRICLSLALVSAAFLLAARATPWWPDVSFVVKHTPLCEAENIGLLPPTRAHYLPGRQSTVDVLRCTPKAVPRHTGQSFVHSLVVVSDLGGLVQRFDPDGGLRWQRRLDMPRGIDVEAGRLYIADGRTLHVIDAGSGEDVMTVESPEPVTALKISGDAWFIAQDTEEAGALGRYRVDPQGRLQLVQRFPQQFRYARGIDIKDGIIYVADTFGHRVVALREDTQKVVAKASSFFPNSVQVQGDRVLVAEEHLNAVTPFMLPDLQRQPAELGCRSMRGAQNLPEMHRLAEAAAPDGSSVCASAEGAADDDLYSPNDAVTVDGFTYVTDGDNHRVIAFRNGQWWGALEGFNSPVNVRALQG